MKLSHSQLVFLSNLSRRLSKRKIIKWGSVEPVLNSAEISDFIDNFAAENDLKIQKDQRGVYGFRHVGMHTDPYFGGRGYWTLLIFVRGYGELGYIDEDNKVRCKSLEPYSVFAFDHKKPHDFIAESKGNCFSIICHVSKKSWIERISI